MRGWRSAKVSTIREEFDEINDSMKVSSSRMKNKVGAQKGAFIKMKQENIYIYQRECAECYVPIIAPSQSSSNKLFFHNNLLIFFLAYLFCMV
ncbi:hypothetical protein DOW99_08985 [Salmonella enterica subsp. enterica]|nr:hypothetical protein [Salmonella enterica subsp. enterica serovar Montevideo]